jgi:hypothetical protein
MRNNESLEKTFFFAHCYLFFDKYIGIGWCLAGVRVGLLILIGGLAPIVLFFPMRGFNCLLSGGFPDGALGFGRRHITVCRRHLAVCF